jgi:nucleoside-diphosphate-sugar epimerase
MFRPHGGEVGPALMENPCVRVTVLGGTGFLGPEVVRQFVDAGCDVAIFHRGGSEAELPASVRHIHGDRRQLSTFLAQFRSFNADVVVDMRPMTEDHARQLVSTFAGVAKRAVVISSADVYRAYGRLNLTEPGPPDPVPLREDAPLRDGLYADQNAKPHDRTESLEHYDKLLVEGVVSSEPRLPAAILRLGMVHGPRSYRHYPYLKRMVDGRPGVILADPWARWRGTLAYSENVAAAIVLAAMRSDAQGAYNVGDDSPTATIDIVAAIAAAAHWAGRIVTVPSADLPASMRPGTGLAQELILDSTRIRRELGFNEPVSTATGMTRTVDWMLGHPPTPEDPMGRLELDYRAEDVILAAR